MPSAPTAASQNFHHGDAGFIARLRRRLRPPRLLSLTRAGKFFILMTLGVGFGAINTGNNLLFLLFGMMLSVILASGLLSEAVLRNLRPRRRLPRRLEAGQPAPGRLRLVNVGWWPALSVEVSEQNPHCVAGPLSGSRVGPKPVAWWKFWRQQTDDEIRPVAASYTMRVEAGAEKSLPGHYELPERGKYSLSGLQIATRFPFSLFEKSRQFDALATITVLPSALPADRWMGQLDSRRGDTLRNKRGRGEEYFGLREYRPGEDQRMIHWKSTARRGEPMVKETEARQRRALEVIFDNRAPSEEPTIAERKRFELGIRHLAGLLQSLHRAGYRLRLITCEAVVDPGSSTDMGSLLRHLATIGIEPRSAAAPVPGEKNIPTDSIHIGFSDVIQDGIADAIPLAIDELSESQEEDR